jgi:hypothetical protein
MPGCHARFVLVHRLLMFNSLAFTPSGSFLGKALEFIFIIFAIFRWFDQLPSLSSKVNIHLGRKKTSM